MVAVYTSTAIDPQVRLSFDSAAFMRQLGM